MRRCAVLLLLLFVSCEPRSKSERQADQRILAAIKAIPCGKDAECSKFTSAVTTAHMDNGTVNVHAVLYAKADCVRLCEKAFSPEACRTPDGRAIIAKCEEGERQKRNDVLKLAQLSCPRVTGLVDVKVAKIRDIEGALVTTCAR